MLSPVLSLVFPSIALRILALRLHCLDKKVVLERIWSNSLQIHLYLLSQGLSTSALLNIWGHIIFVVGGMACSL